MKKKWPCKLWNHLAKRKKHSNQIKKHQIRFEVLGEWCYQTFQTVSEVAEAAVGMILEEADSS